MFYELNNARRRDRAMSDDDEVARLEKIAIYADGVEESEARWFT